MYESEKHLDAAISQLEKTNGLLETIKERLDKIAANQMAVIAKVRSIEKSIHDVTAELNQLNQATSTNIKLHEIQLQLLNSIDNASLLLSQIEFYKNKHNLPFTLHFWKAN